MAKTIMHETKKQTILHTSDAVAGCPI